MLIHIKNAQNLVCLVKDSAKFEELVYSIPIQSLIQASPKHQIPLLLVIRAQRLLA